MDKPRLARDIINEILAEVSPTRYELLRKIVEIEDNHLSDKGTTTISLVSAEIERVAKIEAADEP
jgi:hypothetical protein